MIALLAAALAGPCAPRDVQVGLGADVHNLWISDMHPSETGFGLSVEPVDPGWSGAGGDVVVTAGVAPCLRVGGRAQLVVTRDSDPPLFRGHEVNLLTFAVVGGEVGTTVLRTRKYDGLGLALGLYLEPGLRTVITTQRVQDERLDLDQRYGDADFVPILYTQAVAKIWPLRWLGVHADLQLPTVNFRRELSWFANRFFGVGVDVRILSQHPRKSHHHHGGQDGDDADR